MGRGPWRRPDYHGDDIYPGLDCWDAKQSGSICVAGTRLPLWAVVHDLLRDGWYSAVEDYLSLDRLGRDELADFLYCLLEARGEFGRLLMALAAAELDENVRRDESIDAEPWWAVPEWRERVAEQLRRCLEAVS